MEGNGSNNRAHFLPDVEVVSESFLLSLVSAADVVASALVSDELPVRLHHHCVEVLHAVRHVRGHRVAGPQRQNVLYQPLRRF